MALAHAHMPLYGVQFHPESVATSYGNALLANFRDMTAAHHGLLLPHDMPPATANGAPLTLAVLMVYTRWLSCRCAKQ